jgi:hypothetical protein
MNAPTGICPSRFIKLKVNWNGSSSFTFTMSSIKVTKSNVTRKIRVDDTSSWEVVSQRILEVFPSSAESLALTYVDRDNDVITLSTIVELRDALGDGVKKFDLALSMDQDPSASDSAAEATTVTTKREGDVGSDDEGTSRSKTRGSVSLREQSYHMDIGRRAIIDERGAPSTQWKRKRIQGFWFAFLEEHGFQREWDTNGPSAELCAGFMNYIAENGVGVIEEKITVVTFNSIVATFLYLVSKQLDIASVNNDPPPTNVAMLYIDRGELRGVRKNSPIHESVVQCMYDFFIL